MPVDRDPPLPDLPIGLAPRAEAGVADVLVESHPERGVAGGLAGWQIGSATAHAEPEPPLLSGSLTQRLDIYVLSCHPIRKQHTTLEHQTHTTPHSPTAATHTRHPTTTPRSTA